MKALLIGGTGTISTEISKRCVALGWDLTLLNRGNSTEFVPEGARVLQVDVNDEAAVNQLLGDEQFDVVADFIVFTPEQAQRDIRLFKGRTAQYIFISSASAYQKPLSSPVITESTPLYNPYWGYSRNKIAIEDLLMDAYRKDGFPVTIVRPSHTYCERSMPVGLHGNKGSFAVMERIRTGKKIIVPGDGLTLWTVTHSSDFAVGFCGLMGNIHAIGEAVHITSDERLTWNQIHECIGRAVGRAPQMVHIASDVLAKLGPDWEGALIGDKSNSVQFDNTKIKRLVPEFCATVRFDQGAYDVAEYVYTHAECQVPDPEFDAWCDEVIERYEKMISELPKLS
ncbi:MAG: SDR family oxidoreductase [Clostridiales bacterium]|nr:SDR family oxidoreductase [Clostridiales bacterium]